MDQCFGDSRYTSSSIADNQRGFVGLQLHRERQEKSECVARIIFWDAVGQFSVETLGTDVPLEILEGLIAEAKESIKVE